jgi:acyl dehydratase
LRDGAGEAAFLVAEQLAFDQFTGDRGAIHLDEGAVLARAPFVDRAGHQFLARSVAGR